MKAEFLVSVNIDTAALEHEGKTRGMTLRCRPWHNKPVLGGGAVLTAPRSRKPCAPPTS